MNRIILAVIATASFAASAGIPTSDQDFVTTAGQGGLAEVAIGKLAASRSGSDAVKTFAKQMVADHTKGNAGLMAAAQKEKASVPSGPSEEQHATLTKLEGLKGAEFDKAFVDVMVTDHKSTIELFEKESSSGGDGPVKTFATSTLPTLRHHLEMAQSLQGSLQ